MVYCKMKEKEKGTNELWKMKCKKNKKERKIIKKIVSSSAF